MLLFHGFGIVAFGCFDGLVGLLRQLVGACAEIVDAHAQCGDSREDDAPRRGLGEKVESGVCCFRLFDLPRESVEGDFKSQRCRSEQLLRSLGDDEPVVMSLESDVAGVDRHLVGNP